ncbi:MAG: dipicolinate synthase subunit DpsA [Woeseiaceae bacterium]|nr:dipicolinate synthase subunit DpsA [Woeseiaceae bacterium]
MEIKIEEPEKWAALELSIVGGDEREQEIARLAVETGARVRVFAFPMGDDGIDGTTPCDSVEAAFDQARIVLFPIPGIATDNSIFATEKIVPSATLLSHMADNGHIILGRADQNLEAAARANSVRLHEYEHDQELMLLRAPAIVEGALQIAIDLTRVTIHDASVCVVGQGNIGTVLTRTLVSLGAKVTVAARNPVQRAAAYTMGAASISTDELLDNASNFDMIMSTVPAPLVTRHVIDRLPDHALVMDLSAPPGGCDLDYAEQSGRAAVWARALGRRAPITVGQSQWFGIAKIINEIVRADN